LVAKRKESSAQPPKHPDTDERGAKIAKMVEATVQKPTEENEQQRKRAQQAKEQRELLLTREAAVEHLRAEFGKNRRRQSRHVWRSPARPANSQSRWTHCWTTRNLHPWILQDFAPPWHSAGRLGRISDISCRSALRFLLCRSLRS